MRVMCPARRLKYQLFGESAATGVRRIKLNSSSFTIIKVELWLEFLKLWTRSSLTSDNTGYIGAHCPGVAGKPAICRRGSSNGLDDDRSVGLVKMTRRSAVLVENDLKRKGREYSLSSSYSPNSLAVPPSRRHHWTTTTQFRLRRVVSWVRDFSWKHFVVECRSF